ncbi:hypothetical protein Vretimale_12491, partial [Volvox reticuliferus]
IFANVREVARTLYIHCKGVFVTIGRVDGPFCLVGLLGDLLVAGQYKRALETQRHADGNERDKEDVGPLLRPVNECANQLYQVYEALMQTIPAMSYDCFLTVSSRIFAKQLVCRKVLFSSEGGGQQSRCRIALPKWTCKSW